VNAHDDAEKLFNSGSRQVLFRVTTNKRQDSTNSQNALVQK